MSARTAALGQEQPLGSLSFHRLLSSTHQPLTGQIFQVYILSVCFHQERPLDRINNDGADRLLTANSGHYLGPERVPLILIVKVCPCLYNLTATPANHLAYSELYRFATASSVISE